MVYYASYDELFVHMKARRECQGFVLTYRGRAGWHGLMEITVEAATLGAPKRRRRHYHSGGLQLNSVLAVSSLCMLVDGG